MQMLWLGLLDGNNLKIRGSEKNVNLSADALKRLYEAAGKGVEITKETLHLYIQDSQNQIEEKELGSCRNCSSRILMLLLEINVKNQRDKRIVMAHQSIL